MPDAIVLTFVLAAAAAAALVARLAFSIGGRRGLVLLVGGFAVLAVANLVMMPFTDPARIASGAVLGFVLGAVVGLIRFGAPFGRGAEGEDAGRPGRPDRSGPGR